MQQQQQTVGVTKLRLTDLNTHLICVLCGGYFIDATTIVECLHSFCRSCIIKYLEGSSFCPLCDCQIHKAKPYRNLKPDKALQDIVYKLVPGLFHSEMRRRREFYAKHPEYLSDATTPEGRGEGVERLIYSPDDSISLSLEYLDPDIIKHANGEILADCKTGSNKRYLQCPALVTISHLKKFLRYKFDLTPDHVVEVIHRRESLPDDYTLMDVAYIYTWKRSSPMRFFYRIYEKGSVNAIMNLPSLADVTENTNGSAVSSCAEEAHDEQKEQPKAVPESNRVSVEEEALPRDKTEEITPAAEESTTEPSAEDINPLQRSHRDEEGGSKEDSSFSANKSALLYPTSESVTETHAQPGKATLSAKIPKLEPGHRNASSGKTSTAKLSLTTHSNVKRHESVDEVQGSSVNVKDTTEVIVGDQSSHSLASEKTAFSKKENEEVTSGSNLGETIADNSPGNAVKTPSTSTETPHNSSESSSNTATNVEVTPEIPSAESCALSESEILRGSTASQSVTKKTLEEPTENIAAVSSESTKNIAAVSSESTKNIAAVSSESTKNIAAVSSESTKNIAAVSSESTKNIAAVSSESTKNIAAVSSESTKNIAAVSSECTENIAAVSSESTENIAAVSSKATENIAAVSSKSTENIAVVSSESIENIATVSSECAENITIVSSSPKLINESPVSNKESCSSSDNSDSGILVSPSSSLSETLSSSEKSSNNSEAASPSSVTKECPSPSENNTLQPSLPTQNTEQTELPLQNKNSESPSSFQSIVEKETSILENRSTIQLLEQNRNMEATQTTENSSPTASSEKTSGDKSSSFSQATEVEFSEMSQACTSKGVSCQSPTTQISQNASMSNSSVLTADETRKLSIEHSIDSKTMQVLKSECEIKNMYSTPSKTNQKSFHKPTIKAGSLESAKIAKTKSILWKKLNAPKTSKSGMKQPRAHSKTRAELINKLDKTKKDHPQNTQPTAGVDKQNLKYIPSAANNMKTPAVTPATATSAIKESDKTQATRNILKNNQQILKKNDEIVRTVNTVLPYLKTQQKLGMPYQNIANLKRKQQTAETLPKKNCSIQSQVSEEKPDAKKRRVMMPKDSATVTSRSANTSMTPEASISSVEKKPSHAVSHDPQSTKTQSVVTPSEQASQLGKRGSSALEATSNTALSKTDIETLKRVKTEASQNGDKGETTKTVFCVSSNGLQIIPISSVQQESSIQSQSTSVAKKTLSETSFSMTNKSLTSPSEDISVRPLNNKLYTKGNVASNEKKLSSDSNIAALLNKSNSVNTTKQRTLNSVPAHASTTFAQPSPSKTAPKPVQKFTDNPCNSPRHPSQGWSPRDRPDITSPSLLSLLKQEKTSEERKGPRASGKHDNFGALDLTASPRRAQHSTIVSIADTLARRQQLKCTSPPALSPFPVTPSLPLRSPPPPLRIPVPGPQHRAAPQQRPSSLSSSSPSPPAESPGSSRMALPAQDMYMSPFLPLVLRQQLELQRMWNAASASENKPLNPSASDWYGEGSVKRLENLMKSFHQQQQQPQGQQTKVGSANVPLFPYANNRRAK